MKLAFLYAGQGSQKVGMGKDFYKKFPLYKETLDSLPNAKTIKEVSFNGPEEKLSQTLYTQPCMVAFAIGITNLLKHEKVIPDVVAGLSLGEYSALAAAEVLSESDIISLVSFRAKAMEEAAKDVESAMVAVLGVNEIMLTEVCEQCADVGIVEIANINCPGQIVLSGEKKATEKAMEILKEKGIKKCVSINTSGPFHTQFMKPAGNQLKEEMKQYEFKEMTVPVVFNRTGEFLQENEQIPILLEEQVQNSVLFEKTIHTLESFGIDTIVEIGPGKVLSGFVKRTNRDIHSFTIEDVSSFEKTIQELEALK